MVVLGVVGAEHGDFCRDVEDDPVRDDHPFHCFENVAMRWTKDNTEPGVQDKTLACHYHRPSDGGDDFTGKLSGQPEVLDPCVRMSVDVHRPERSQNLQVANRVRKYSKPCDQQRPEVKPSIAPERRENEQKQLARIVDRECATDRDSHRLCIVLTVEEGRGALETC